MAFNCVSAAVFVVVLGLSSHLAAGEASGGNVTVRLTDQDGRPLGDIFVGLLEKSGMGLPILSRSDSTGLVHLRHVASGAYEVLVRSSKFRKAFGREIEVRSGQTELVSVILQQVLGLEVLENENLSPEALLKATARNRRRMILRGNSSGGIGFDGEDPSFGGRALVSVTTNPTLGGDYLSFPSDSANGAATNFAFQSPLGLNGSSILAGQIASGEDSLWRLKNFVRHGFSDRHSLEVVIGYGRVSQSAPTFDGVDAPIHVGDSRQLSELSGPFRSLTLGVTDQWSFGESFTLAWGVDLNRIKTGTTTSFAIPSAEVAYSPFGGTRLSFVTTGKRRTSGNTLQLMGGESVNLSDGFLVSRIDDELRIGRIRYNQAAVEQRLSARDRVELAAFSNQVQGFAAPYALSTGSGVEVLQLQDRMADTSGYRITYERRISPHLSATVTYLRSRAAGVGSPGTETVSAVDARTVALLLRQGGYHSLAAQLEAHVPASGTWITALVKFVPEGNPIPTLDAYSDRYQTSNEGVNVFVRQVLPLPRGLFDFLGLDFLTPENIEAMLDIRNLTNEEIGSIESTLGPTMLIQNPRTIRGGISLRF